MKGIRVKEGSAIDAGLQTYKEEDEEIVKELRKEGRKEGSLNRNEMTRKVQ